MSGKPLFERLQIKAGRHLAVVGAPPAQNTAIGVPDRRAAIGQAEVVLLFLADRAALVARLPRVLAEARRDVILWLAYPKLSSTLAADLSRDVIHALAPDYGLTTVAAVAIDADWSALRLKRTV